MKSEIITKSMNIRGVLPETWMRFKLLGTVLYHENQGETLKFLLDEYEKKGGKR